MKNSILIPLFPLQQNSDEKSSLFLFSLQERDPVSRWRLGRLVCVWLLFAVANLCLCLMIVFENNFSAIISQTQTIFDCNRLPSLCSRLLPPFESRVSVMWRDNGIILLVSCKLGQSVAFRATCLRVAICSYKIPISPPPNDL